MFKPKKTPLLDANSVIKDAIQALPQASRRQFLQHGLTLGGLSLLSGCSLSDEASVERALMRVSGFNDKVQAWLLDPNKLAPTYPDSMITRPFPFNAFYDIKDVPKIDGNDYRLKIGGMVANKNDWSLAQLNQLAQTSQITRHVCVEGWSAIGKWGGVTFATFLKHIGADLTAKYVGFKCADDYYTSIDMPTALHAQTLLSLTYDGQTLPPEYGYPMKLRIPTKLGYKNPKHITAIYITNVNPGGYWEDQGYNWFGGG